MLLLNDYINVFNLQSEYIADCDQRRAFVSGFDGSSGKVMNQPVTRPCIHVSTIEDEQSKFAIHSSLTLTLCIIWLTIFKFIVDLP